MDAKTNTPEKTTRTDMIGQEIVQGNRVVTYYSGMQAGLSWGTVEKINPKMLRVKLHSGNKVHRYPRDVLVLEEEQVGQLTLNVLSKEF
jgi:hypothetical protein